MKSRLLTAVRVTEEKIVKIPVNNPAGNLFRNPADFWSKFRIESVKFPLGKRENFQMSITNWICYLQGSTRKFYRFNTELRSEVCWIACRVVCRVFDHFLYCHFDSCQKLWFRGFWQLFLQRAWYQGCHKRCFDSCQNDSRENCQKRLVKNDRR